MKNLCSKMKIAIVLMFCVFPICWADKLCGGKKPDKRLNSLEFYCGSDAMCEIYDETMKSYEIYCKNYTDAMPNNCFSGPFAGIDFQSIENSNKSQQAQIQHFKARRCHPSSVLATINNLRNLISVDISYCGFETLDYFASNQERLTKINASHNGLNVTESGLAGVSVTEIDLSYNKLDRIESDAFGGAVQLLKIHLSHNSISFLADDAFTSLTNLEFIDLSHNNIHWIDMFRNNKKLKTLLVANNPIFSIDCNNFLKMSSVSVILSWQNVRYLYTNCEGTQFHVFLNSKHEAIVPGSREIHCNEQGFEEIQQFTAGRNKIENVSKMMQCFGATLKELHLSGNFVGKLNTTIFNRFTNLEWLSLSDTTLLDFNFDMLEMQKKLERLDVSFNNLKSVNPMALENFKNLSHFIAAGSQLENTLEIIQHLMPSMKYLDLSGNLVGKVNASTFEKLGSLETLKLNNTNLVIADVNPFEQLKSLNTLDLSKNHLNNVNFSMLSTTLNGLIEFNAANCRIEDILDVVRHLGVALSMLDLSGNHLASARLNTDSFKALINLNYLDLSCTNIEHFNFSAFKYQMQLRFLNISYNRLRNADLAEFTGALVKLDLEGNDLIEIGNFSRSQFPQLESLAISENQFSCEFLRRFRREWDGLKFINDPMKQKHRQCHLKSDLPDSTAEITSNSMSTSRNKESLVPNWMYIILLIAPPTIIVTIASICFVVCRQILKITIRNGIRSELDVFYQQKEIDMSGDDCCSDHTYEELDSTGYDHLRFDTVPLPLSAIKSHYHNASLLKNESQCTTFSVYA